MIQPRDATDHYTIITSYSSERFVNFVQQNGFQLDGSISYHMPHESDGHEVAGLHFVEKDKYLAKVKITTRENMGRHALVNQSRLMMLKNELVTAGDFGNLLEAKRAERSPLLVINRQ